METFNHKSIKEYKEGRIVKGYQKRVEIAMNQRTKNAEFPRYKTNIYIYVAYFSATFYMKENEILQRIKP